MRDDGLITQDELDFILDLQHNPTLNRRDPTKALALRGGIQISDLLTRLAANEQVTLQAQFDNQQMSFPVHLVEDEFHALHLELGAPTIYEDGPRIRPWRMTLNQPVALESEDGGATGLWLHEISLQGALLEVRQPHNAPPSFSAWFAPEGHPPLRLQGTLQRLTDDGLAAYRLHDSDLSGNQPLRQYLLKQHRRLHPALHAT